MYCEGTADILDAHGCGVDTHVFMYTDTPSAADSLRPRDGTQWLDRRSVLTLVSIFKSYNFKMYMYMYYNQPSMSPPFNVTN